MATTASTTFTTTVVTTRGGLEVEVQQRGSGPDLVWFHGLVGLAPEEPALDRLAETFTVHAPIWPGYGEIENEEAIEDMLDFALLGWDIVDALFLDEPTIVGHSFGAMVAAEMACLARADLDRLVLIAPYGLWLDAEPLPDPFATLPFQLAELLFDDAETHASKLVTPGLDLESNEGLAEFMVRNSRRLGTAGKIMFPIPNRRLSKRLYRIGVSTMIIMAEDDQLVTSPYGPAWQASIEGSELVSIGGGHLVNLENPQELANLIAG